MSAFEEETVLSVHHWTETLFSFTTTRNRSFRFKNGQFSMIGLSIDGRPLLRAYSIASPNFDDKLEFFSIKVPEGPLTSRLLHIVPGDKIIVGQKPTGTLLLDNLLPGRHLYLLGTGTGLAPFLSFIRDPETYENFEKVILVHGTREVAELAYSEMIEKELPEDEFLGDFVRDKLIYYPTVTREPFRNRGRITDLISSDALTEEIGLSALNAHDDRVMICGNHGLNIDLARILKQRGFLEGNGGIPGTYVVEKAFVER
jgi:ferredoxin/flavodoxin---NADP+ reductase